MSQYLLKNAGINGTKPALNHNTSSKSAKSKSAKSKSGIITNPLSIVITSKTNNGHINAKNNKNNAKNANNANTIKVQGEFMDAMTNAIIRYLDKNQNANKTDAEQSVFTAIGYDESIELESKNNHKSFVNDIQHFRRHHIMRNRDAIRTFRIKQIIKNVTKQYPTYSSSEVLIHLTTKLNELYLPSPSPPIIQTKKNTDTNKQKIDDKCNKNDKNKTNSIQIKKNVQCLHQIQCRNNKNYVNISKGKIKNVNYTINHANNDRNGRNNNNNNNNNTNRVTTTTTNKVSKTNNINLRKQRSPSQIYITMNGVNKSCGIALKSNSKKTISDNNDNLNINKQGIGFKQSIISSSSTSSVNSVNYMDKNIILSNLVECYPTKNKKIYTQSQPYFVSSYDDDQVSQKIKLHKKSRKRKFQKNNIDGFDAFDSFDNFDNFDNFDSFDNKQPPKKRSRIDSIHSVHSVHGVFGNKGRGRTKNKGIRGRARGKSKGRATKKYNHSTECFDDEEDEGSDIDLNSNINNLSTTTNSHLSGSHL